MSAERVLVVGWFSFELMGSTAGDVIAKDVVCGWLRDAGCEPVVAMHEPAASDEVAAADVEPDEFATLVFVCGPIGDGPPLNEYLARFPHARKVAVDVTVLDPEWRAFEHVVERDGDTHVNPDITFVAPRYETPVVGVVVVGSQDEYADNRHDDAEAAINELVESEALAAISIDTRLDLNATGLRTPEQVESAIARMDVVLTTRLHGAVLALRRGVPPVVIDSIPGGSKLLAQMRRIGWPLAFDVAELEPNTLHDALRVALSPAGRQLAHDTAARAAADVDRVHAEFVAAVCTEREKAR